MRSYWKIKLWAKIVSHFDVFDNLWRRKTQCDHSNDQLHYAQCKNKMKQNYPMYSAITQIKLIQNVILNPLKFEQQSIDQGFQFNIVWIFRYSILSDQLALLSNVCSDLLTVCFVCLTFVLIN